MSGNDGESEQPTATLDGADAALILGGGGEGGDIFVADAEGTGRFEVDGGTGSMALADAEGRSAVEYRGDQGAFVLGGEDRPGRLLVRDGEASVAGEIRAREGELTIYSADGTPALTIMADGTIRTAKPIQEGKGKGKGNGGGRG